MTSFKSFIILAALCIIAISARRDEKDRDHDSSNSKSPEKSCDQCADIKRRCPDYSEAPNCHTPKVKYFTDKHGCRSAIIRCKHNTKTQTLKTKYGEVLFIGEGSEKLATCKNNKWSADDSRGDYARVSSVYCLDDGYQNPAPYPPQPSY